MTCLSFSFTLSSGKESCYSKVWAHVVMSPAFKTASSKNNQYFPFFLTKFLTSPIFSILGFTLKKRITSVILITGQLASHFQNKTYGRFLWHWWIAKRLACLVVLLQQLLCITAKRCIFSQICALFKKFYHGYWQQVPGKSVHWLRNERGKVSNNVKYTSLATICPCGHGRVLKRAGQYAIRSITVPQA